MKFNRTTTAKKSVYSPVWPRFTHDLFLNFLWMEGPWVLHAALAVRDLVFQLSLWLWSSLLLHLWFIDQVRFTYHTELPWPAIHKRLWKRLFTWAAPLPAWRYLSTVQGQPREKRSDLWISSISGDGNRCLKFQYCSGYWACISALLKYLYICLCSVDSLMWPHWGKEGKGSAAVWRGLTELRH